MTNCHFEEFCSLVQAIYVSDRCLTAIMICHYYTIIGLGMADDLVISDQWIFEQFSAMSPEDATVFKQSASDHADMEQWFIRKVKEPVQGSSEVFVSGKYVRIEYNCRYHFCAYACMGPKVVFNLEMMPGIRFLCLLKSKK